MSCAKIVAQLVVCDLADESRAQPERRGAGHAVRRRAAADLARRAHRRIELVGFVGRQQPHRALGQPLLVEERIVAGRDHVDDRIADRHDIEAWGSHGARR